MHSVQPPAMSVSTSVEAKLPAMLSPQCTTKSASTKPGVAFPRLSEEDLATLHSAKAERLAMEEIARGLVHYDVPAWTGVEAEPLILLPANRRARR